MPRLILVSLLLIAFAVATVALVAAVEEEFAMQFDVSEIENLNSLQ